MYKRVENLKDEDLREQMVSIIVPIYNSEKYVERCLDSIVNQTYRCLDIILIDDGSTDNSGIICDQYAEKDQRVVVVHQMNQGLVLARKRGMELAHGSFCMHVDSDDWIDLDAVEKLLRMIKEYDVEYVQAGYVEEPKGINHTYKERQLFCENDDVCKEALLEEWYRATPQIDSPIWNKIYRTDFIKKCYGNVDEEYCYGEDQIAFVSILKQTTRAAVVSRSFYHYQVLNNSMSHKFGIDNLMKEERLIDCLYQRSKELFPFMDEKIHEYYYYMRKLDCVRRVLLRYNVYFPTYSFPDVKKLFGKRVAIYGAGNVGRDVYMQLSNYADVCVTTWVDREPNRYNYGFCEIRPVDVLSEECFDYIIIALANENKRLDVRKDLEKLYNIPKNKIIWDVDYSPWRAFDCSKQGEGEWKNY